LGLNTSIKKAARHKACRPQASLLARKEKAKNTVIMAALITGVEQPAIMQYKNRAAKEISARSGRLTRKIFNNKKIMKARRLVLKPLTTSICLGTDYSLHVFIS